jgi:hypothetical protein
MLKAVGAALLVFATGGSSLADECDPAKILIRDSAERIVQIYEMLNIRTTTDQTNKQSNAATANYAGLNATHNVEFANALKRTFNLSFEGQYQSAEAYLRLPDNARKAYESCLDAQTKNLYLTPSLDIMSSESTYITIKLRDFVTTDPVEVSVSLTGDARLDQDATFKMNPGGKRVVRVKRNLDMPFTLHVQAGKDEQSLSVPGRERFKIARELRYSPNQYWGHGVDRQAQTHILCIDLAADDDAILVPGSDSIVTPYRVISKGGIFSDNAVAPQTYNTKQVCRQGIATDDGTNNVSLAVCGFVVASVIARVPIEQSESKYGAKPAYVSNERDIVCKPTASLSQTSLPTPPPPPPRRR